MFPFKTTDERNIKFDSKETIYKLRLLRKEKKCVEGREVRERTRGRERRKRREVREEGGSERNKERRGERKGIL